MCEVDVNYLQVVLVSCWLCLSLQDHRTALHWACSAGHAHIVQFLLDLGVEVDMKDDVSQHLLAAACSLLVTAVYRGNLLTLLFVLYLVQASWTPLHIAASAGREEIVRSLIGKGAQLNSVNQNGCTPLHYAASKDRYEVYSWTIYAFHLYYNRHNQTLINSTVQKS